MKKRVIISAFLSLFGIAQLQAQMLPYQNVKLTFEQRVNDLVSRMTLEEKVSQMVDEAPAIPRLGIPEYNWWNECLHGVARAGLATVFPEPIGSAASFDADLISRIGNATSDEARAKYNDFIRQGKHGRYEGLTFWSPNINIFRDPRWGRGMETYGEDPYLTSVMGVNFIKGLQGNDPKYLKLVATAKHYMVHSGPESERHRFNATTDQYDFLDTYLPAFKKSVQEGKAFSIMSAYNSYNGVAASANIFLLSKVLRQELGFNGYVVSDCDAVADIYEGHKEAANKEEASAMAVTAGTDLNCGSTYRALVDAVKSGLISEDRINTSVKRLLMARFKLGMFDPDNMVKYASIPYNIVNSKAHQQLALEAARKSIVLLKNANQMLPLSKGIKNIAIIGPNANDEKMLWGNYNGIPAETVTPLQGIKAKLPDANVVYARGCELAETTGVIDSAKVKQNFDEAISVATKSDVVIMFLGLSPRLEGEEMKVQAKGFSGGDRETIDLPKPQEDLIKAISNLHKPLVLVLLNGSALAINWEAENVPAIIDAWYGGQAAGTAIADVLFGDYNPAGRLPVTFYKSTDDLPDFHDYSMRNRTYRYFNGEPLYPFGYGLSYTTFKYSKIKVPQGLTTGESYTVTTQIQNTGNKAGEEIVQLYVKHLDNGIRKPIVALKGFKRIYFKAGEIKTISFNISPESLSLVDKNNKQTERAGISQIFIGGAQPDHQGHTATNITAGKVIVKGAVYAIK
ncbi:glycoside hydrolase family 3 C-terminal domain-containing protein [Mucilaginibacter sp. E4BP6]|uniref:glycoside hydrolase family 3 C-terminal domain-containing protein n=1 Tax=Mucilaginibacter sp. E4BP6 TaxID=2723089 RepID=UPI0015C82A6C|nr:glycoside hydrolase family 3 C-terminal domain-containing protein [Mucilaginibacter sp. E4BP6]NYE65512.1 beta-glucosidase [Mucilaginibacter sp. E4BP6]